MGAQVHGKGTIVRNAGALSHRSRGRGLQGDLCGMVFKRTDWVWRGMGRDGGQGPPCRETPEAGPGRRDRAVGPWMGHLNRGVSCPLSKLECCQTVKKAGGWARRALERPWGRQATAPAGVATAPPSLAPGCPFPSSGVCSLGSV